MRKFHCFEVFGIELEYMVVRQNDLRIAPIADRIFIQQVGKPEGTYCNGLISWSNELVAHVIELKTTKPVVSPREVLPEFQNNVRMINETLRSMGGRLLPTACHPLMDPFSETTIWPHDAHEIYDLYNRIFDCRGHGWSNVQSMHLNLPFYGEEEFDRLHTAIRLILPILPALCASSPILEGKRTPWMDSRMHHYQLNQEKIPVIAGKVIPEYIRNQKEYQSRIFDPINSQLEPYDHEHILDHHFVNSRGAIARFDRGSIEIRVMDIQECPAADIAIAELVIEVLKALVNEEWSDYPSQAAWHETELYEILQSAIHGAEGGDITHHDFWHVFGLTDQSGGSFQLLWSLLYDKVRDRLPLEGRKCLAYILEHGTLATRILKTLEGEWTTQNILDTYRRLADSLEDGKMFGPVPDRTP